MDSKKYNGFNYTEYIGDLDQIDMDISKIKKYWECCKPKLKNGIVKGVIILGTVGFSNNRDFYKYIKENDTKTKR